MNKFLIIRFSSIGDILLTTPIVRSLKKNYPTSKLFYLTKKKFSDLLIFNPYIDKIFCYENNFFDILEQITNERINVVIDLHKNIRSRLFRFFLLETKSYVYLKKNFKKWLLVKFKKDFLRNEHIVDRYFRSLKKLNIFPDEKGIEFYIDKQTEEKVYKLYPELKNEKYVCISVGGKHYTKQIPAEKIIDIINLLQLPYVLVGDSNDKDKAIEILKNVKFKYGYNFCGEFNLLETGVIVKNSQVVITPDSAIMHISSAFNKKIVSVWGSTVPQFGMYPYLKGNNNFVICEVKLNCRPCTRIGKNKCPKKHFYCMNKQDVEFIVKVTKNFYYAES